MIAETPADAGGFVANSAIVHRIWRESAYIYRLLLDRRGEWHCSPTQFAGSLRYLTLPSTGRQLSNDAHRRKLRTPFGRATIRYRIRLESIPHRVRALVGIRATAGRWLWIKNADFAETEIATMRYVANHTVIPVPRVWFSFKWGNCEYIDGDKQDMIAGQLARHMAQLRSLAPPPNSSISSVLGGPRAVLSVAGEKWFASGPQIVGFLTGSIGMFGYTVIWRAGS
ncbi:hypothetical protein B0H14DRAFT_3150371 [Mycena olivaceomarginata]|nr:hypothetical protein B0H14DRAFT_3150371 [Mycena olivaceomarginata]